MAGLVRRKTFGQIFPPSATSQDPEDAVHYFAAVLPRSAPAVIPARRLRDKRGDDRPLFISQFFSSCHSFSLTRPFMRWLLVFYAPLAAYHRTQCPLTNVELAA